MATLSRFPVENCVAWLLASTTFPLIWMGGLVTTYGAGMAVPDWPNTYGYNLFLYPWESWWSVWDVFLEHSHRLVGAMVGLITIGLAWLLWRREGRRWMGWLGLAAVAGVSFQGLLGGLRVIDDEVLLAKVHGCTAPLFFVLTTTLVTLTSARWKSRESTTISIGASTGGWVERNDRHQEVAGGGACRACPALPFFRLAVLAAWILYSQIVLGAQLRHLVPGQEAGWFELFVWLHLIVAGLALAAIVALAWSAGKTLSSSLSYGRFLRRRSWLLAGLFLVQSLLGGATWVTKYGWPAWFREWIYTFDYTVDAGGRWRALAITAHVAVGSLCLATLLSIIWWSLRATSQPQSETS